MMIRTLFLLSCCVFLGSTCSTSNKSTPSSTQAPSPEATSIAWIKSDQLMPILEDAKRQKKPVFVEFFATWCGPCKMMEREVFNQPEIFKYLNQNFLSYRVDVDKPNGKTIAGIYEVTGLPSVIFLDPEGVVLERELGLITDTRFRKVAETALGKMQR